MPFPRTRRSLARRMQQARPGANRARRGKTFYASVEEAKASLATSPSEAWSDVWQALNISTGQQNTSFVLIQRQYEQPHRHYHTLSHIRECLAVLEVMRNMAVVTIEEARELTLAIFFHDAVYDTWADDNESRSSLFGLFILHGIMGFQDVRFIERIRHLILTTDHVRQPHSTLGEYIIDIDLYSLSLPWDQFWAETQNIRQEYFWANVGDFTRERIRVLRRFLDRPEIYYSRFMRDRCEKRARMNIQRSIELLQSGNHGLV